MPPAQGTTKPPAPGTMPPAPGTMSPAQGTMSPAQGTMSPAPGTMSPAQSTMSRAPGTMSPAQDTKPPVQAKVLPPKPPRQNFIERYGMGKVVMIAGGIGLLLYLILTIISISFLNRASAQYGDIDRIILEIRNSCSSEDSTTFIKTGLESRVSVTVRIIFWTWQLIIFIISFIAYLIFTMSGWQRNMSLGFVWIYLIAIISILNFVPLTYIFQFGHLSFQELIAFWAMLGVLFVFRIVDIFLMKRLRKEIKEFPIFKPIFVTTETVGVIGKASSTASTLKNGQPQSNVTSPPVEPIKPSMSMNPVQVAPTNTDTV